MSTITVDVEVEITSEQLSDAGYHEKGNCHDENGDDCNHENCHNADECEVTAENNDDFISNVDALHDWHETTHGYTIWSGCQQEPCNVLTLDFRKRT